MARTGSSQLTHLRRRGRWRGLAEEGRQCSLHVEPATRDHFSSKRRHRVHRAHQGSPAGDRSQKGCAIYLLGGKGNDKTMGVSRKPDLSSEDRCPLLSSQATISGGIPPMMASTV